MKKKELKEQIADLEYRLGVANGTVFKQMEHIKNQNKFIDTLEKQLLQQDNAIERKDKQFLGLRSAYTDEIINKL